MKGVIVLTTIGALAAFLLALVNHLTQAPIVLAKEGVKHQALDTIVPFDIAKVERIPVGEMVFYEIAGSRGEQATAIEIDTNLGYSGQIEALVGISDHCRLLDFKILQHKETPGLGDKISDENFRSQFRGKGLQGFDWRVSIDGGDVDAVTSATISSRAISDLLQRGLQAFADKHPDRCSEGKTE